MAIDKKEKEPIEIPITNEKDDVGHDPVQFPYVVGETDVAQKSSSDSPLMQVWCNSSLYINGKIQGAVTLNGIGSNS